MVPSPMSFSPDDAGVDQCLVCVHGLLSDMIVGPETLHTLLAVFIRQQVADRLKDPGAPLDQSVGSSSHAPPLLIEASHLAHAAIRVVQESVGPAHRFYK